MPTTKLAAALAEERLAEVYSDRVSNIIHAAGIAIEDEPEDSVLSQIYMAVHDMEALAHQRAREAEAEPTPAA